MYNCELYSVLCNDQDVAAFNEKCDAISNSLAEKGILVTNSTEVANDPKAFTKALKENTESTADY